MLEKELALAQEAAVKAGAFLRTKEHMAVDSGGGKDIKLSSDRLSEQIIVDVLKPSGYPILSEEMGLLDGADPDCMWIIDPLDGTANYWRGLDGLCCTSVALWKRNQPVLGVINRFAADELYTGIVGGGAWKNGRKIRTSDITLTQQAVLATGFPVHRDYSEDSLGRFVRAVQRFKKVRMLGTAAVMGAFVAEGKIDSYMEEEIMLWDIAASSALVLAAGGAAEITQLEDYKCVCKLFANEELKESCHADCV